MAAPVEGLLLERNRLFVIEIVAIPCKQLRFIPFRWRAPPAPGSAEAKLPSVVVGRRVAFEHRVLDEDIDARAADRSSKLARVVGEDRVADQDVAVRQDGATPSRLLPVSVVGVEGAEGHVGIESAVHDEQGCTTEQVVVSFQTFVYGTAVELGNVVDEERIDDGRRDILAHVEGPSEERDIVDVVRRVLGVLAQTGAVHEGDTVDVDRSTVAHLDTSAVVLGYGDVGVVCVACVVDTAADVQGRPPSTVRQDQVLEGVHD